MKTQIAVIEFGSSKILTVIAQVVNDKDYTVISCGRVDYEGCMDGDWVNPDNLSQAVHNSIVAAQGDARTRIEEIYIGVPGEFTRVINQEASIQIRGKSVSEQDINDVQDMAAEIAGLEDLPGMVMHRSPAWYKVDDGDKKMNPEGVQGKELSASISFITVCDYFIEDMRKIIGEAGLTIGGFLSPFFAEMLQLTGFKERDNGIAFIDCGMYSTEIGRVQGDAFLYHAVLPFGGDMITRTIAEKYHVRYDEAEALKRDVVIQTDLEYDDRTGKRGSRQRVINDLAESALEELCEYIHKTLEEAKLAPRAAVYLTGGGIALLRGGVRYLQDYLERKVNVGHTGTKKLEGPEYSGAIGVVDLVCESTQKKASQMQQSLPGRTAALLHGVFGRRGAQDEDE